MNGLFFYASSEYIESPLDCRILSLSIDYYQFSAEQIVALARMLMEWVRNIYNDNVIFRCTCNGKDVPSNHLVNRFHSAVCLKEQSKMNVNGYVASTTVHSISSLKTYQRNIAKVHPRYTFGWDVDPLFGESSIDFPYYLNDHFPLKRGNNDDIRQLIYDVFCEHNKSYKTLHLHPDIDISLCADPYQNISGFYYGHAHIALSSFSLGKLINVMADKLYVLAQQLSEKFNTLNAHVFLQPFHKYSNGSPYMRYFGKIIYMDGSDSQFGCSPKEWYRTYYLCGVEWANILSPLTATHFNRYSLSQISTIDKVVITQKTNAGTISVKSQKQITDYSFEDAILLKKILEPALFPGRTSVPLRGLFPRQNESRIFEWCPRYDWALIPIEKQEIEIVGSDIVYTSLSAQKLADVDYENT